MSIKEAAKRIDFKHNVSIRVIDRITGDVVSEHTGHNASTNSMLTGIAHYLIGEGVLNQGSILSKWVPRYISLGTMGLLNQNSDDNGLPLGIGVYPDKYSDLDDEGLKLKRYVDYMNECPGFGADGYDVNSNNGRKQLGLGPMFTNRDNSKKEILQKGDINFDGVVDDLDLMMLLEHMAGVRQLSEKEKLVANLVGEPGNITNADVGKLKDCIDKKITPAHLGKVEYTTDFPPTVGCELVAPNFARVPITYREIIPENQAEKPNTIDVVFSAYVSTGALSYFREPDKDYLFITEAGLWSRPDWIEGGDNGLLAGYRIAPPDEKNWKMAEYNPDTNTYSDSKDCKKNRKLLKQNIIRVGKNQVVQIVWKIQLGGIEQLGGIKDLYHSDNRLIWHVTWDR